MIAMAMEKQYFLVLKKFLIYTCTIILLLIFFLIARHFFNVLIISLKRSELRLIYGGTLAVGASGKENL
jgi:hypothetical protein